MTITLTEKGKSALRNIGIPSTNVDTCEISIKDKTVLLRDSNNKIVYDASFKYDTITVLNTLIGAEMTESAELRRAQ